MTRATRTLRHWRKVRVLLSLFCGVSKIFMSAGITVKRLYWQNATGLSGVLHTKFMLVDALTSQSVAYMGSANFDWRSLSQVKVRRSFLLLCRLSCSCVGAWNNHEKLPGVHGRLVSGV